jgi:hypothetical protein
VSQGTAPIRLGPARTDAVYTAVSGALDATRTNVRVGILGERLFTPPTGIIPRRHIAGTGPISPGVKERHVDGDATP